MENAPSRRLEKAGPVLVFLASFAFFLAGLNPSFYVDDSPETLTAGLLLGIPHPPGYPLYTLLGRLFSAMPLGPFPFRINLLSAVMAASACVLLYAFLKKALKVSTRLAAPIALLWAVGATAYPAALGAKGGIYQFTVLFLLAILWALWEERPEPAGFLLGLSLANHWMTMLTFLPGLGVLLYSRKGEGRIDPKRIYRSLGFLLLGLSAYLFLPLRAAQNPWLNWGNPSTWHNFVFDFLRSQYADTGSQGPLERRLGEGWAFLKASFLEFGGLFLVAPWGFLKVYAKDKSRALALGLLWLGLCATVVLYLGLPQDQLYLVRIYLLPAQALILVFTALGLQAALEEREEVPRKKAEKVLAGALVLLLAGLGVWRAGWDRQTDYTFDYDYVLNGFKSLPQNALYFCKGDSIVFPCWYFQWAENIRPDVVVVGVDGFPMEWVRRNLALYHPGLKMPKTSNPIGVESIPSLAQWMVDQNRERELYFSYNDPESDGLLSGVRAVPYGLACKGFLPGQETELDEARADFIWGYLRLRHLREPGFPEDKRTRSLMVGDYGIFRNSLGVYYENLGDDAKAKINPHSKAEDLLRMDQDYEKCLENFQWAEQLVPENAQFNYNLGNAEVHVGRLLEAFGWYEKAVKLNPRYTLAYFNWAVAALQAHNYAKARELFKKVLDLQPENVQAQQGLDLLEKMNLGLN